MQIGTNYQSNTNFTGGHFTMPQYCQKRFMRVLRNNCNVTDLVKIRNTIADGVNDKTKIILEDLGYMAGQEVDGHLCGTINGKEYYNSWPLLAPSTWSIPKFFAKLARKADKAELKLKTKNALNTIDECRITMDYKKEKALAKAQTKFECKMAKDNIKEGYTTEQEEKNFLLGQIYRLLGGKRR